MRSFGPDDPIESIHHPRVSGQKQLSPRYQGPAVLAVSLFTAAFSWLAFRSDGGKLTGVLLAGMSVLCVAVAVNRFKNARSETEAVILSPAGRLIAALVMMIVFAGIAWYSWTSHQGFGGMIVGGITALIAIAGAMMAMREIQNRRIAHAMRAAANTSVTAADARSHPDVTTTGVAAPLRLDFYLQQELEPLPCDYSTPISADRNIVGQAPLRILYLYNFFSDHSLQSKLEGGWRRFGPVYFLGSPQDVSYRHTFDLKIEDAVTPILLATCEAFDQKLAEATEAPLAPGNKELMGCSYLSGGYPHHLFLCTDANWRHAVEKLFELADAVIMDASGYQPGRGGLNWEMGYVLDHVSAKNFVVLMDRETDQVALAAHFRDQWAVMRTDSPNNWPDVGAVRFVLLNNREESQQPEIKVTPPDPLGLLGTLNLLQRHLLGSMYARLLEDDRIFGLLMSRPQNFAG